VRLRPQGAENPTIATGEIELGECVVEVLSRAETPPFPVDDRSGDRRVDPVAAPLRRHPAPTNAGEPPPRVAGARGDAPENGPLGFVEVETPLLWTPTPEGAREFAVPSRLHPGDFYVLPQSPQIAKQLLMVAGCDRYFQIARCLRDEDLRADRQFEFSQLDIEMSFAGGAEVQAAITRPCLDATEAAVGERPGDVAYMTWHEAMDTYGTDKPDLRFGMELVDLDEIFEGTEIRAFIKGTRRCIVVPGGAELGRSKLDGLVDRAKSLGAGGLAWFKVDSVGPEVALTSPLDKLLDDETRSALVGTAGAATGDLILIVADEWKTACTVLGQLRLEIGRIPVGEGPRRFVWVTDFPMFEGIDDAGRPIAAHHPFTMPNPDDIALMETDPLAVRSSAYDLVLNGWELGSGSVRIHSEEIQRKVFDALGISTEDAEARFGFLLGAFRYGAPPHAGFAVGIDRFVAILAGEENIREVIAFPKTQSGSDLMTGAPRELAPEALRDLHLRPSGGRPT
jgi:aspartyl-tRNA synthetase